ncbi:OmpA family protein [Thermophagus sp. OGC60D27]|uniref:OmpA family protein n=1 Tax=Thermophagus sp. OGC60D27 TaxID=3458415 RepID=UPI00403844F8
MRLSVIITLLIFSGTVSGQIAEKKGFIKTPEMIYSFGQKYNTWSVGVGFGPVFMYADQRGYTIIPDEDIHFGPSVLLTKHLVPAFGFELQYLQADMSGKEGRYGFEGDLLDFSINGIAILNQMSAHPGPINDHWNFYLKIGVGATLFRSRLLFSETGEVVQRSDLYETASSEYVVLGYDKNDYRKKKPRQSEIVMPFGLGVMYRLNNRFDVGVESILRFSTSDNLDNILTGATNDRYLFTSLNVSYKLGDKDRRHVRWTYRSEGMDLLGRKQKDNFEDEVRRLADEMALYEANRPVKKDSVVISETLKIIYDRYNVRTLFFPERKFRSFSPADQLLMGQMAVQLHNSSDKKLYLYGYYHSENESLDAVEESLNQCKAVKDFMVKNFGIDRSKIEIIPKGTDDPIFSEGDLSSRVHEMVNRRVDMVLK